MKKIFAVTMFLCCVAVAQAQTPSRVAYQGEVQVGYGFAINRADKDRFSLQTIHGIRVGRHFSTGLGVGLNDFRHAKGRSSNLSLPLFLNAKGYLPVSKTTSFFASIDLGYAVRLTGYDKASHAFASPSVGARFRVAGRHAITFSLGYECSPSRSIGGPARTDGALCPKLGYQF